MRLGVPTESTSALDLGRVERLKTLVGKSQRGALWGPKHQASEQEARKALSREGNEISVLKTAFKAAAVK
jgi:hypothetical protein